VKHPVLANDLLVIASLLVMAKGLLLLPALYAGRQ